MSSKERRPLESIEIIGYKSILRLPRFRLHKGVNLLIGANGSGKSNFIRFFEMLASMMDVNKGMQNYVGSRGRADAFLFRGMRTTPMLSAHLWFGLNEYKFGLQAAHDRSLFFAEEAAPFFGPHFGETPNNQGKGHVESRIAHARHPSASLEWVLATR